MPWARTVWLVRHAESHANAGLATTSPDSIPITARGRDQAAAVADLFAGAGEPPDLVVTSSYIRTGETAGPLHARLPGLPREVWPVHEFTYLSPAPLHGTTTAQRRPLVDAYWQRADPRHRDGDDAESLADLFARVATTLEALAATPARRVAVFTHGQWIRAVLWSLLFEPPPADAAAMRRFHAFSQAVSIPNAGVVTLRGGAGNAWHVGPVQVGHIPEGLRTL